MKDFFTEQLVKHSTTAKENKLRAVFTGVYIAIIIYILLNFCVKAGNEGQMSFFVIGLFLAFGVGYMGYAERPFFRQVLGILK